MGNPIPWDLREPGIPQQITGIPLVISQMSLCYRTSRGPFPSLQNMGRSRPSTRLGLVRFRDSRAVGMRPPLSWCHVLPDFVQSHCVCKRPEACTACLSVASLSSGRTVRSTRVVCNLCGPMPDHRAHPDCVQDGIDAVYREVERRSHGALQFCERLPVNRIEIQVYPVVERPRWVWRLSQTPRGRPDPKTQGKSCQICKNSMGMPWNPVEMPWDTVACRGMPWNAVECRRGSGWGFRSRSIPGPP